MEQKVATLTSLPHWVPQCVHNYIAHTEAGLTIRALARATQCHPSTILRQVRRLEGRRDDPLVDDALRHLSQRLSTTPKFGAEDQSNMKHDHPIRQTGNPVALNEAAINSEAKRVLRRLCEQGATLAVAREMEMAVVVRDDPDGNSVRTATVDRQIAQAMALKDWISSPDPSLRITRYYITNTGRAALRQLTAAEENRASGFAEARANFMDSGDWTLPELDGDGRDVMRYQAAESPLMTLARRRDKDGQLFLSKELVAAGERLREDFELAAVGRKGAADWASYLANFPKPDPAIAPALQQARDRVFAALTDLGPGLGDAVLRCCCYLEGLEQTEKTLGWSARSGKVVVRIALQRLRRHYTETLGKYGPMIG